MRFSLAAASEAEKSAVLAVTDQDSQTFADQARAATARGRESAPSAGRELRCQRNQKEKTCSRTFSRVSPTFCASTRSVGLDSKNNHIKAFALAFGPAAQAAQETDSALSRFLAKHAISAQKTLLLAAAPRRRFLRLETRLPPHMQSERPRMTRWRR